MSQFIVNNCQIEWVELRFASHSPYSPDSSPSDYWLVADLKKLFQGKRFGSNEEVMTATKAYFERKDKALE